MIVGKPHYGIEVATKPGVPMFEPFLTDPAIFEHSPRFREFLLCKSEKDSTFRSALCSNAWAVVNASRAGLEAPEFARNSVRTRKMMMEDIFTSCIKK